MNLDEIMPGTELEPFAVESVSPEKMKLMAALLRDPNPIHFDPEAVQKAGLGDRVVNQGPINLSYLVEPVTRWAGGTHALRSIQVRFLGNVFGGDRFEARARVTEVDREARLVTLELEAEAEGKPVLAGTAVVAV